MTGVIATVRPDSWNFPLFVHVLGAMILVGGLLTGASILTFARGDVHSDSQWIAAVDGRVERSNRPPREPQRAA